MGRKKLGGAQINFRRLFRIVPELSKKRFRRNFPKLLSTGGGGREEWLRKIPIRYHISHKIDRIFHKIDRVCPIYFYNKPILPDCEGNWLPDWLCLPNKLGGCPPPPPPPPPPPARTVRPWSNWISKCLYPIIRL
jgi:hypothetical protein